jgi:hypothetical protein
VAAYSTATAAGFVQARRLKALGLGALYCWQVQPSQELMVGFQAFAHLFISASVLSPSLSVLLVLALP